MIQLIICDDDHFTREWLYHFLMEAIRKTDRDAKVVCQAASANEVLLFMRNNPGEYLFFLDLDLGQKRLGGLDRSLHMISREAFVLFEMGLVFFFAVIVSVIKKKVGIRIQMLIVIDRKYPNMKKWIVGLEIGTMAVIMLLPIPFVLARTVSDTLQNALAILDISLLVMQMLYMVLLYKITDYRHTMQFADREKEYYSSLNAPPVRRAV